MTIPYKPTLHPNDVNVSEKGPLRTVLTLLGSLLIILSISYISMGLVLDQVAENITPETEQKMWSKLITAYELGEPKDAKTKRQLNRIRRLFKKLPKDDLLRVYPFQVHISKTNVINAFAVPGGHIIVTSALIDAMKSDRTLTFILGHELGHFQNADHLKSIGRELVFATLIRTLLGDDVAGFFAQLTMLFDNQYSQRQELRADEWGLKLLVGTYNSAKGATDFFEWLMEKQGDRRLEAFFETHPAPSQRIKRIMRLIKRHRYKIT